MPVKIFLFALFFIFFAGATPAYAALSCSITTAAACTSPSVVVLRMSSAANAHAELPSQSTAGYAGNVVCCGGVTGLSNSCSGTFAVAAKLSAVTNAHIEQNSQSIFANNACISVPSGSVSVGYQASNCTGFDTTLASMTAITNAHLGSPADYATKICASASAATQSLTFSISDASVGFGSLSSAAARYAIGDTLGSASETEAHTLSASTNAALGYTITVQGGTLASGGNTITAIGSTNTSSTPGTEQFGLRMTAAGGSGGVSSPYAAAGFAYAASASTPSTVASAPTGDSVTTTYSVRYLANIAPQTEPGAYATTLTYIATANF